MKQKLLLILAILCVSFASAQTFAVDGINYTVIPSTTEVTVSSGSCYTGDLLLPSMVSDGSTNYTVTSIGDEAFRSCIGLTSISFPSTVTSIGGYSFAEASNLASITMGVNVTSIREYAFADTALTTVSLGSSVTVIGNGVFSFCRSLETVTNIDSVISIGDYAFSSCYSLTSFTFPNSVTTVGSNIFAFCEVLSSVTIGANMTEIGASTFSNCPSLSTITIPSNIMAIGDYAFSSSGVKSVTIPTSVSSIGYAAFSRCEDLKAIIIPNSVSSIGDFAFARCINLNFIRSNIESPITIPQNTFSNIDFDTCILIVPTASVTAYQNASVWQDFTTITDVVPTTVAPSTINATQVYDGDDKTIGDLQIDGTDILWYDAATNGNLLENTTVLVDNTTYYASQTLNGIESIERIAITVKRIILPATHLNFDGVNDYITLPVAIGNTLSGGSELTIEYWFKGTNLHSAVRLQSGSNYIVAGWGTSSPQFLVSTDGGTNGVQIADVSAVYDNNWHHVACVWKKNGSFSTYLDGGLSNSRIASDGASLPLFNNVNVLLGALNGSSEFTKGSLDDVRIWNVARTPAEINSSKNCALQGNETGLVAYYNFNQGNGGEDNNSITSLTDGKGNNNGTLNGFALNGNTSNFSAGSPILTINSAIVTTPVTYNAGATATALTATLGANGTSLVWYTTPTGGTGDATAPTPSTATVGSTSYWVASTNANGCESARTEIVVTVSSVAKIEIMVTATASQSKVYGATEPVLTYTVTPSLANGDAFTGTLTREPGENVGTYAIGQGDLSADSKYTITFVSSDFTITPKSINVTAAAKTKIYGTDDAALTYAAVPSLLGTDSFTGTLSREAVENVGTYAIEQGTLSAGANYVINFVSADLTITPKAINVTAAAKTKVYGTADVALTYVAAPSLLGTDTFTGTLSRVAGENAGTYAIAQGTLSAGANYAINFVSSDLTITAKPINVTADAKTKVYGTTETSLTYSVSPSLAGTDSFIGTLSRAVGENAGTYAIAQGTLSAGANYAINFVSSDFTITPKAINVTAAAKTKVYGTADVPLTYIVTPSLIGGDSFTGALNRAAGENAGTYAITQGTLNAGANYVVTFVPANYSITKADQVITWNQTLVSDCGSSASIALTATSTSGLGISFSSSNSNVAKIVNNELVFVNPGSATITATQVGDNNYNAASSIVLPIVNSQPNLIRKQFDNIIFFDNSSNQFVAYTWYKNGVVVAGQTAQYFKETGALTGSYYAVATKRDGTIIRTCPLVLSSTGVVEIITLAPNPVRSNSNYQLITNIEASKMQNARVSVFNLLGTLMTDKVVNESTIEMVAPSVNGIYIVKLTLSNGKMFTKNLLVRN